MNDQCAFGEQLKCEDYIIHTTGVASVKLRNNFGVLIDITNVDVKSDYGISSSCSANPAANIAPGTLVEITCDLFSPPGSGSLTVGEKVNSKFTIQFKRSGSSNLHPLTGQILVTVVQ